MFERFTEEARAVLVDAHVHARRLGHGYIGCEHLLLAVASNPGHTGTTLHRAGVTTAAVEEATLRLVESATAALDRDALAAIGIDLDVVREKIEASFGPNALAPVPCSPDRRGWGRRRAYGTFAGFGHIPCTSRAKNCLELSLREAVNLRQRHIGAEHIALALTSMTDGLTPQLLSAIGVPPALVRAQLLNRDRRAG